MGNQQGHQQLGDSDDKGSDFVSLHSVSKISMNHLIETDLEDDEFKDFLNEEKDETPIDALQRLWIRDSGLWAAKFNNKRDKFLHMVKLTKSVKIKSMNNYENKKDIQFQIDAELTFSSFLFLL